jgi:alpha-mannosidase
MFRAKSRPKSRLSKIFLIAAAVAAALPHSRLAAQTMTAPDITKQPTIYVFDYAHLDTQWRWEFPKVIS